MNRPHAQTGFRRGQVLVAVLLAAVLVSLSIFASAASLPMLSAREQSPMPSTLDATLYFRYRDSALLARERRQVSFARGTSPEQAMVAALVEGPGSLSPHLTPLFPPGTQVLSVSAEEETLFVTFNAGLMGRYSDEPQVPPQDYRLGEGRLRRQLALAALVNTLTEAGRYRQVQVLVRDENYISASMRLSSRYFLEDEEQFLSPLVRQEEHVFSPYKAAELFMDAWRDQDWQQALALVRGVEAAPGDAPPTEHTLSQRLPEAPRLVHYALTPGTVALDGQSAVVSVSYTLLKDDGTERKIYARPFRVLLQEGVFLIPFDTALRILELQDE